MNRKLNSFKKILACLLAICMTAPLFNISSFADTEEPETVIQIPGEFGVLRKEFGYNEKKLNGKNRQNVTVTYRTGTFTAIHISGIGEIDNNSIALKENTESECIYEVTVPDSLDADTINLSFDTSLAVETTVYPPNSTVDSEPSEGPTYSAGDRTEYPRITSDSALMNYSYRVITRTDLDIKHQETIEGNLVNTGYEVDFDNDRGFCEIDLYVALTDYTEESTYRTCKLIIKKESASTEAVVKSVDTVDESCQFSGLNNIFSSKSCRFVTSYGGENGKLKFEIADDAEIYLDGDVVETKDDEGRYILSLDASKGGSEHTISIKQEGSTVDEYNVKGYTRDYSGLPDKVVDYLCMASQYTNGANPDGTGSYGSTDRAVMTLRGGKNITSDNRTNTPPVSLGNFGGYITYYYADPIINDPNNPYGIDFIVCGNSVEGTLGFAEPGNVLVSEDGNTWYNLAGSLHYDNTTDWNYHVNYKKENGKAVAYLDDGSSVISHSYPSKNNYPLFTWTQDLQKEMSFTGVNPAANGRIKYPAFGYADCGIISDSNEAANPYGGIVCKPIIGYTTDKADGFDLAWAVDSNGQPKQFEHGIQYIKIQTATLIMSLGEKSTEINMVRRADPDEGTVGETPAPESISIDGQEVPIEAGKYVYGVDVKGVFDVNVNADEDSEVYINSWHGNNTSFNKLDHGIVRVIIQKGKAAPLIYYFNINQNEDDNTVTTIELDALERKGLISDYQTTTCYYDKESVSKELPIPVSADPMSADNKIFDGWVDSEGNVYTDYYESMPETLSLSARWITELEKAKRDAIEDLTGYVDLSEYKDAQAAEINSIIDEGTSAINAAENEDAVESALADAKEKIDEIEKAEDIEKAVAPVEKAIAELPAADELTLDDKAEVNAVQAMYNDLTDAEKAEVSNATTLKLAETVIEKLEIEEELARTKEERDTLAREKAGLEQQKSDLERQISELDGKLKSAEDDKAALQKEKQNLENELSGVNKQLEDVNAKLSALEKDNKDLGEQLTEAEKALKEAEESKLSTLKKVKIKKAKGLKRKAKITWKKVAGAKGYEILVSKNKKGTKGAEVYTIKKNKTVKLIKKLKKGKYYVKVRAYKDYLGNKLYGKYSKAKKIRVK